MKLVHPEMNYQVDFSEGKITGIFFDDPVRYRDFVTNLLKQSNDEEGLFVLSEDGEEISFSKNLAIISDVLNFDIEDKRVSNKVQSLLKSFAVSEDMFIKTQSVLSYIEKYAADLSEEFIYPVSYTSPEASAMIKMLAFKIDFEFQDELERLSEYINILHDICDIKAFVILGAFSCFSLDELKLFSEECSLKGHSILFLESNSAICNEEISFIEKVIIDSDGCEIF